MYEEIKKTRDSGNWQLVANFSRFSQVASLRRTIATRTQTHNRYDGQPRAERNEKRRYIDRTKIDGHSRVDKSKQLKRRNERAITLWPNRKDKTRKSLRLQSLCNHTIPTKLRYEEAGCVIGAIQENRLHGCEYQHGISANGEQSSQVEATQKINFRCPAGGQSERLCPIGGRTLKIKKLKRVNLSP